MNALMNAKADAPAEDDLNDLLDFEKIIEIFHLVLGPLTRSAPTDRRFHLHHRFHLGFYLMNRLHHHRPLCLPMLMALPAHTIIT